VGIDQDATQVTFAPKVELADCELDWQQPAFLLHNLIRSVNPHPGAWCHAWVRDIRKRVKIYRTRVLEGLSEEPGTVLSEADRLVVVCGEGALEILELQVEGKKTTSVRDWLHGGASLRFDLV